jgi:hypothetical protein
MYTETASNADAKFTRQTKCPSGIIIVQYEMPPSDGPHFWRDADAHNTFNIVTIQQPV